MKGTPMARPRSDTPRAADRILSVANARFTAEGSRAIGVDEIVARAGTTKPTLYRAFGSKDGLIAAWMTQSADAVWMALEAGVAARPDDPKAQLLAAFDALNVDDARGCTLSNTVVEYPARKHAGRKVAVVHKERVRERLRDLTRAINARKPRKLADSLLLLLEGTAMARQIFGTEGPSEAARGAAEALIAAHIRRDKSDDED